MLQKEKSGRKLFRFSQTHPDSYERAADTVRKNKSVVGNPLLVTSESNFLPDSSVERKNIRNFVSDSSYPELTYTITLN